LTAINTDLATQIPSLAASSRTVQQELQSFIYRLENYTNSAGILAQRVEATLGLVRVSIAANSIASSNTIQLTNLLDLGNQHNSREISTRILRLTQEGVDDNATVKVITIFTLIYLPASFMAVSSPIRPYF
jgi:hypothetical protein